MRASPVLVPASAGALPAETSSEEASIEGGTDPGAAREALKNDRRSHSPTTKISTPIAPPHSIDMSDVHLDRLIGGGAFGQVYRGTWQGTTVAVKILTSLSLPRHSGPNDDGSTKVRDEGGGGIVQVNEAVLRAFEDEVDVFARLRHPNICLFLGACLSPPTRAIVTELVARGSLWEALRTPGLLEVCMPVYVHVMHAHMHICTYVLVRR
jgi:serine/threonine protein kinase